VALKILRGAWPSPARRQRFESEQRTLAQLNHPSIARLYDAGTLADGTPWFVMEYVDGVALTDHCRERDCNLEQWEHMEFARIAEPGENWRGGNRGKRCR
jgi:eukaryotic-like serine/threonine-protein kinase